MKSMIDKFIFITSSNSARMICQVVKVIWQKATLSPQIDSSLLFVRLCQCAPHTIYASLDPPESTHQTASRSVQPFLHRSRQRPYRPTWAAPFPLKIRMVDLDLHLMYCSVAHPNPQAKRHLDWFSRFAGLTIMIGRQTDKQTTLLRLQQ